MAEQANQPETKQDPRTEIHELGPCKKLIRVEIGPETINTAFDKQYRDLSSRAAIKGFRKGKVPRKTLERMFGSQVEAQVKDELIYSSLQEALDKAQFELLSNPEPKDIKLDREKGLSYEVTLLLRPSFTLPELKGLKIEVEPARVPEEDVDRALQELSKAQGDFKDLTPGIALEEGDAVVCDIDVWLASDLEALEGEDEEDEEGEEEEDEEDDKETDASKAASADEEDEASNLKPLTTYKGIRLVLKEDATQMVAGIVTQNLADDLLGLSAGETADVDVVLPSDYEVYEGREQPAVLRMKLCEAKRLELMVVDDALAKRHQFESLADLRSALRNRLLDQATASRESDASDELIAEILKQTGFFELPQDLLISEMERKERLHFLQATSSGMSEEQARKDVEDKIEELRAEALGELKRFFVLDAVGRKEKIEVDQEDFTQAFRAIAQQSYRPIVEVQQEFKAHPDRLHELRWNLMESKVLAHLLKHATIVDKA